LALCLVPAANAQGPAARKGFATTPATSGATDLTPDQELSWKARRMELDYRDRLGRLRRLRELAVKRGDVDRTREIDKLYHMAQQRHADHVKGVLQGNLDPETRARLDEELCAGRAPQELAEFKKKMKERAVEHRDLDEKRAEFRSDVKGKPAEHRVGTKEQPGEFREPMKDKGADGRLDTMESRGEFRDATRAANEREWDQARDRVRAEMAGKEREEAIKRIAADRMNDDARRGREAQWRRAAMRDGSLGDDLGPFRRAEARNRFRMVTQKEADELAAMDIAEDNADAEFQRLREELAEPTGTRPMRPEAGGSRSR
jgi:hypothetical protein